MALAASPLAALAVKPSSGIPAVANVYYLRVRRANGQGCPGVPTTVHSTVGFAPDGIPGATFAWDFFISPWTTQTGLASGSYEDGTYPSSQSSALRAIFQTNNKVFSIDTRSTAKPVRTFNLDFNHSYDGSPAPRIGANVGTPGLFQISSLNSLTSMAVCTTTDCPEWRAIKATFWFDDPTDPDVEWRVDWAFTRVLRVSTNTWYIIADACGGSQVAGLSELQGNRTRPREVNSGYFLMPLFIGVTLKQ
jgi:hypothetical protein